jgi:choline kinase
MQAVILAAGDGGRMYPLTTKTPKPLLQLDGRALIHHVLEALSAADVCNVTVVAGHESQQLRDALRVLAPSGMTLRVVENASYALGNARSLWEARAAVQQGTSFVLTMADHIIEPDIVRAVTHAADGRCRLAVDFVTPEDQRADEATRALVDGDLIVDLGKDLAQWNALDTGVFWCTPAIFDAMTPELRDGELGAVFASLARGGELDAVDVTGRSWIDVDTRQDLRRAAAFVRATMATASGAGTN